MQDRADLKLESYSFYLPSELIASRPIEGRDNSRLLVYNAKTDTVSHHHFYEVANFLPSDSLLVMNQSKVFPCRLFGNKKSGGKAELFLLSLIPVADSYECLIRARGKKEIGDEFYFDNLIATITSITDNGSFFAKFNLTHSELLDVVEKLGQIPIPPYIRDGVADEKDKEDYQTIYAKDSGSVAAPTAGLHFTEKVFDSLKEKNIKKDFVTLHVGAGTFKTVQTQSILEHKMHKEFYAISQETLKNLNDFHGKIFAVGTTSLRTLESAFNKETNKFEMDEDLKGTDIFLYPGKEVNSIAGLITNFHLPESTLLMLVSSLIGREKTLELYDIAIKEKYRFFSYGDAMLIIR